MKCDIPVPLEKLIWFQKRLGLGEKELEPLNQYREFFQAKKAEFSENFYQHFYNIAEAKFVLDRVQQVGHLKKAWMQWFDSLFKENFSPRFFAFIWRSGLRHVEVNVDQRFINLGYSFVRHFCLGITRTMVPPADRESLMFSIDKAIDLCLLVETQAYIAGTSQCDMEVVKGISHQVRNPLTVIGGHVIRLKRQLEPESPLHRVYENILNENKRLENMVIDAGTYSEMFEKDPALAELELEHLISDALEKLKAKQWVEDIHIALELDAAYPRVQGGREDLNSMFYYLLQNSLEAVDAAKPFIKISSSLSKANPSFVEVEIFNNGRPPTPEDMNNLFVPFYSSKPYGTGLGLPIAQLAARKSLGELHLEPVAERGTRCIIELPLALKNRSSAS